MNRRDTKGRRNRASLFRGLIKKSLAARSWKERRRPTVGSHVSVQILAAVCITGRVRERQFGGGCTKVQRRRYENGATGVFPGLAGDLGQGVRVSDDRTKGPRADMNSYFTDEVKY